jgi:opacity protein-like surface antigen
MKKLIILFLSCFAFTSHAQHNYLYVGLDISKPSTPDFVNETSANGIKIGYRFFVSDRFSVGIDFNRNIYDQYQPKQTFSTENGHLTTDYFTYIYSFGVAASGQYNFNLNDKFFPYVGLGLGALNNEYVIYYNIYKEGDQHWGFVVRPEAGIIAKLGRSVGAFASITYDYTTNKSEYFELDKFSTVGFQLGLVLMSRR